MSFYVQTRWGGSENAPSISRMKEILAELDTPDAEHPDAWLTHETGWTLSVFESGLVVWENSENDDGPRHRTHVSRDESLRLWLLLVDSKFNEIEDLPWAAGYGPPISEEELARRKREAEEIRLELDRQFYDKLGAEDTKESCRHPSCGRGTVRFSVYCRPHHFENLHKRPSPFNY